MKNKALILAAFLVALGDPAFAGSGAHTRVVVRMTPGAALPANLLQYAVTGRLDSIGGQVLDVPDSVIPTLTANAAIASVDVDRPVFSQDFRTDISSGSFFVNHDLGVTGRGVTVAVIDSGVDASVDDLHNRVVGFVDFVGHQSQPYDDNGHGTHVAGIIAGSGMDSRGQQAGIAADASIVALKVLDANGRGNVSDVIAALDWVAANANRYGIRVVNVSLAAAVSKSVGQDALAAATDALVDRGIIVVAAAGNHGLEGSLKVMGGIGAPGNDPQVITVGASSSLGTLTRNDDAVADFSSRGPALPAYNAKPDIVAGGVGIISTSAPGSTNYLNNQPFLLPGTIPSPTEPYEVMTGTSMAAPAVTGTIALMLQANPRLTPNLAKAILEYTAQWNPAYRALAQGAGFLNALGAVELSAFYATAHKGDAPPSETIWSRHIIWGNHRVGGNVSIVPAANAWATSTAWGVAATDDGENIVWGTDDSDNIIWGTADDNGNIVWGTADDQNVVWGTECGGNDCENIVWGTDDSDNIIWGTDDDSANIIWGTDDSDNIIWGTDDDSANIIWGTDDSDNIIWGTVDSAAGAGALISGANPSYIWFLNRRNDGLWIFGEFGDGSIMPGQGR